MASRTLNYRQRLFLVNYLGKAQGSAEEAARLAGYKNPASAGSQLLQHPIVYAAIQAKLEEAAMGADEVLARISDMASTDIDEFFTEEDVQVGVDELANPKYEKKLRFDYAKAKKRGKTHLIKKIKVDKNGDIEFELHNAADALDKLAKIHGLYKERIDIHAQIGDSPEDRSRFTRLLAGFAYLEGASFGREDGSEAIASTSGNDCDEWSLGTSEAPAVLESEVEGSGDGGDEASNHHVPSEAWESPGS